MKFRLPRTRKQKISDQIAEYTSRADAIIVEAHRLGNDIQNTLEDIKHSSTQSLQRFGRIDQQLADLKHEVITMGTRIDEIAKRLTGGEDDPPVRE